MPIRSKIESVIDPEQDRFVGHEVRFTAHPKWDVVSGGEIELIPASAYGVHGIEVVKEYVAFVDQYVKRPKPANISKTKLGNGFLRGKKKQKVAVVTGATGSIGRAIARSLRRQGARVVGLDLDGIVTKAYGGDRDNLLGIQADLTKKRQVDAAFEQIRDTFGPVDVLFPNVGYFKPDPIYNKPSNARKKTEALNHAVNFRANKLTYQAAFPQLVETKGTVMHTGTSNLFTFTSIDYCDSKAAARAYFIAAAREAAPHFVNVNTFSPSAAIDSELYDPHVLLTAAIKKKQSITQYQADNPMKCLITCDNIGDAMVELTRPVFKPITGAHILYSGGRVMGF